MDKRDLREDLKINKFKLEDACEVQPSLYMYYADELAEAKAKKDNIDEQLELLTSKVELNIRENPPNGMKITNDSVKAVLLQNEKIIEKRKELIEIKERIYHLDAVVKALDHRKSELNNLVNLYIAGYYSMPVGKRITPNEQARNSIRNNLNRKEN